jgi:hypothetical protein
MPACEPDAGQKCPSRRGAHAFVEVTVRCNKEVVALLSLDQPPDCQGPRICQLVSGLALTLLRIKSLAHAGRDEEAWEFAWEAVTLAFATLGWGQAVTLHVCVAEVCDRIRNPAARNPACALAFVIETLRLAQQEANVVFVATVSAIFPLLATIGGRKLLEATWDSCERTETIWYSAAT